MRLFSHGGSHSSDVTMADGAGNCSWEQRSSPCHVAFSVSSSIFLGPPPNPSVTQNTLIALSCTVGFGKQTRWWGTGEGRHRTRETEARGSFASQSPVSVRCEYHFTIPMNTIGWNWIRDVKTDYFPLENSIKSVRPFRKIKTHFWFGFCFQNE